LAASDRDLVDAILTSHARTKSSGCAILHMDQPLTGSPAWVETAPPIIGKLGHTGRLVVAAQVQLIVFTRERSTKSASTVSSWLMIRDGKRLSQRYPIIQSFGRSDNRRPVRRT
jgi:hypothetical protein